MIGRLARLTGDEDSLGAMRPVDVRHDPPNASDTGSPEPLLTQPSIADRPALPMTSVTAEAVIWPVRVASEWAARLLLIGLALYVLLVVLQKVSLVAFAFTIGLFFTAVLHPAEKRLRAVFGGRKSASSLIVLLTGVILFGLIGWFVVNQITSHADALSTQFSDAGNRIQTWLRTGPFHLHSAGDQDWSAQLGNLIRSHRNQLVSGAVTTAQRAAEIIGGLLLALITTFFLLRDGDLIWRWVLRLVPSPARTRVDRAAGRGWQTLGGYIRGQVSIAMIHSVTIFVALVILRVPLAAALAVLIFLGSFVPLLGLTVTGSLCVAVAFLEHGVTAAVILAIIIVVLIQLEGHVLQPVIMSRAVHIHPLAVALAVAAGTTLYGLVGALVAVPLAAFLNSFVRGLREESLDPVTEEA
jgi:predicted PurR-regulated permease PerM